MGISLAFSPRLCQIDGGGEGQTVLFRKTLLSTSKEQGINKQSRSRPSLVSIRKLQGRPKLSVTALQKSPSNGGAGAASALLHGLQDALLQTPSTWQSSIISNAVIFVLGFSVLKSGLTIQGIVSAFLLGTFIWRAFGSAGFLLVVVYFVTGTAVTKVKIQQKEREGIAEKRRGKRGPSSVWGSGAAATICALLAIFNVGGPFSSKLWRLGFVASFATKLSDTVSSEIGKAYGKRTYLVTTLKPVPRGTEGAISLEGTLAGLFASLIFSVAAFFVNQISSSEVLVCLISSQIANFLESYAGATLQDKKGYEWLNNDVVNVLNITIGATIAISVTYLLNL